MLDKFKKRKRFRMVIPAHPAFNIYSHIAIKSTALGPACIATIVNKMEGWDVEIIDENNLRIFGPRSEEGGADHKFLQRERPADVVGFYGGLTSAIPRLYKIAQFYKNKGILTIAGGSHFVEENLEEALLSGLDYLVIGEGEITIKELIWALEGGQDVSKVKGIAFLKKGRMILTPPREPLVDFDNLPFPDFSLVRYAKIKIYPVGRIRGCVMDCEFCSVKGKPRYASPKRLLETISLLVETRGAKHFFIVDDLFGQQRNETIRFCNMLRDYQISIGKKLDTTVQIRLDKARDSELLSAMRQSRINTVAIGFESTIEEELEAMDKHVKPQEMLTFTKTYHKFGFLVHGMFIFGYPLKKGVNFKMSVKERIKRMKNFIRKAKIDTVQVLLPIPLPGTKLRDRLKSQNRIYPTQDVGWEYYDGNFPVFEPDEPMPAEEMHTSIRKIMYKVYQFKYIFVVGLNVFSFPALIFFLHNIKLGWETWHRSWRNSLIRFGGWITMRSWASQFKKDNFLVKLKIARGHLKTIHEPKAKENKRDFDFA